MALQYIHKKSNSPLVVKWARNMATAVAITLAACGGSFSSQELNAQDFLFRVVADTDKTTIILKDGTKIVGLVLEESEAAIVIKTSFGRYTIKRSKIKEIRRSANPARAEYDKKLSEISGSRDANEWCKFGEWALKHDLVGESTSAFKKSIELNPDQLEARKYLGHARLEGKWLNKKEVENKLRSGFRLNGVDLVPASAEDGGSNPDSGLTRARRVVPKPTPREIAQEKREREKRRKLAEKFKKEKEKEALGVDWDDRHKIRSKHYIVECDSTARVARTYSSIMEELYRVINKCFGVKHSRKGGKMLVQVYKTQAEFVERTGMGRNTGGFYQPRTEQVAAFHGTFGRTSTTYNVLAHEGTHQIQGRILGVQKMNQAPTWLIEGLAVYFGDGSKLDYKKSKVVTGLIPRDRLLHLQDKMDKGTHAKVQDLIRVPQRAFNGSLYADGWGLIHFLFNGKYKDKGLKVMQKIWTSVAKRRTSPYEVEKVLIHYFDSLDEVNKLYKEHIMGLVPEPAGTIKGDYFTSKNYGFELKLPARDWQFVQPPRKGLIVEMKIENQKPEAGVVFISKSNFESETAGTDRVIKTLEEAFGSAKTTSESTTVGGLKGTKLILRGPVGLEGVNQIVHGVKLLKDGKFIEAEDDKKDADKKKDDEKKDAGKKDDKKKPSPEKDKKKTALKSYVNVVYVLPGPESAFLIAASIPASEYSVFEEEFGALANGFAVIVGNRW